MLPKLHRLPSGDITHVMRNGRRLSCIAGTILFIKSNSSQSRFAIVISKSTQKHAVKRNHMKRIVSESLRHLLPGMTNIDAVFLIKKSIPQDQSQAELLIATLLHNV